ncbi:MAG: ribosome small subunit-dependent GTPase A [Anaerolineales bacterium]|nr:MAG: ribosome small subunit-dependent GTPase A [Anaerolineales bacterium]
MPSREEQAWQHYRSRKQLRLVRKQTKRNRKPKRVRRRNWMPDNWDDLDDLDTCQTERIMPRGEHERRRAIWTAALETLEEAAEVEDGTASPMAEIKGSRGRVIEVSTGLCRVALDGHTVLCAMRGTLSAGETGYTNIVAVGDEVIVSVDACGQGAVEAVAPRRTALVRRDVFNAHLQQVIVANVDQLLIVSSWLEPPLWLELLDRYLITAERNNLLPIICLNKIDLAESRAACHAALQPYVEMGHRVLFSSALSREGIEDLREVLRDHSTVLAGLSGVGKSSLLRAVQPGLHVRTGEVNSRRQEGRHTTSQVTLLMLGMGGSVVDTPGIREFGLFGLGRQDLVQFYPDILAVAGDCRFADCSHTHEPGCGVRKAVRRKALSKARYHSYRQIYDSLAE